jgi:hypothetical protein
MVVENGSFSPLASTVSQGGRIASALGGRLPLLSFEALADE